MKLLVQSLILSLSLYSFSAYSKAVPNLSSPVVDQAGLVSRNVQSSLDQALRRIKRTTSQEIAVLTVKSLEGETIEGYSLKVAEQWKLGTKEKDNGVLLLVSVGERKMRIEVGQGLEGDIPDVIAGRIINEMKPYFKKGDYQSGIILGVSLIARRVGAKLEGAPKVRSRKRSGKSSIVTIIIFILFLLFGRGGRGGLLSGLLLGSALGRSGRSYGGGFSSGGGFGGGSFGGGGGGFSGGGSSGGW